MSAADATEAWEAGSLAVWQAVCRRVRQLPGSVTVLTAKEKQSCAVLENE